MSRRMLLRAMPAFAQQYPPIEVVLDSVDDLVEIGDKGVDVLLRGDSLRKRGGTHPDPEGLVVRKLVQSGLVACASPKYLDRAGTLRAPADLLQHPCVSHITL
jgi:DNA-binding transcriptional LysR family regulator